MTRRDIPRGDGCSNRCGFGPYLLAPESILGGLLRRHQQVDDLWFEMCRTSLVTAAACRPVQPHMWSSTVAAVMARADTAYILALHESAVETRQLFLPCLMVR